MNIINKPLKIIQSRFEYKFKKRQEQASVSGLDVPNNQTIEQCEVKNDYIEPYKCPFKNVDINECTVIDFERIILTEDDWRKIISQGSFEGYSLKDVQVSLLYQPLEFHIRRMWAQFHIKNKPHIPYLTLVKQQSKYQSQIEKDLNRSCIRDSEYDGEFVDQNTDSLRDILTAYSNYDQELGYVQGMNIIVASMLQCYDMRHNDVELINYEVIDNRDEMVFLLFDHIMKELGWRDLYVDEFKGLNIQIEFLDQMIQDQLPELHNHFVAEGLQIIQTGFQKYFITALMFQTPKQFAAIIFDSFYLEGVTFIHRFILAMLIYYKNQLLKKNLTEIIPFIRDQMIRDFFNKVFLITPTHARLQLLSNLKFI
ncbi:hypothetical protein pb186bvf_008189 [Paramecium bursaria]